MEAGKGELTVNWHIKTFNELTSDELYRILQVRVDIFVVEQNCPYPEVDGKDRNCWHIFAEKNEEILAYTRLLPPGLSYKEAAVGRVLVKKEYRGTGMGRELMTRSVDFLNKTLDEPEIRLQAQEYAENFYGSFGFERISETYLEDDIPHVDMKRYTRKKTN